MTRPRILILIVSYHAEQFIQAVLDRIPDEIWASERFETEVLIIDDSSADKTFTRAIEYVRRSRKTNITVLYNPKNQGYGGNQKIGYHYAIQRGFHAVVLLHGDGQYAPEYLPQMLQPLLAGDADVVLGSRMIHKRDALKGRMPYYKWIGNQILTFCQNRLLRSRLAEFHTGYRAFSVRALASIPFEYNSNYFDFDTDILIQFLDTGKRFREIPVPTFYGDELSRVNGFRYAALILRSSLESRLMRWGIFYNPKFDYEVATNTHYTPKLGYPSSHQFALDRVRSGATVLDIGCGPGFMARELARKQAKTISVDRYVGESTRLSSYKTVQTDIEEYDFSEPSPIDAILLLDVIEHLRAPEALLGRLRERYAADAPKVLITTGNIGFLAIRMGLLLGQFNYGKRGILDKTHTRLFTFGSLRRMLTQCGFDVVEEAGLPAPFPLALGDNRFARLALWINGVLIKVSKGLFSYQIAMVVSVRPTLGLLLRDAQDAGAEKISQLAAR